MEIYIYCIGCIVCVGCSGVVFMLVVEFDCKVVKVVVRVGKV